MPKIIQGNILDHDGIIVHQVNCQGVMGAGLAKQIRDKYPRNFSEYKKACKDNNSKYPSSSLLGKVLFVPVTPTNLLTSNVIIANLFGQDYYGRSGKYTDYDALRKGFREINRIAHKHELPVSIPYLIGCGLGGGEWNEVSRIINQTIKDAEYTIYRLT